MRDRSSGPIQRTGSSTSPHHNHNGNNHHPSMQHQSDTVRAALFAPQISSRSSASSPASASNSSRSSLLHQDTSTTLFEQQNNALADILATKVNQLKSISIAIGDETRAQNKLLDEMSEAHDDVGSMMKNTVHRLGGMIAAGGSKHMCYLILFICFIFFVVYWIKR